MKPELLLVGPLPDLVMASLENAYTVHRLFERGRVDQLLSNGAHRIRAIATDGAQGASRALMEQLPDLEIVGIFGVGLDAIDLDYTRRRAIAVTNTPDVLTDDVADLAMLLMLSVARRQIVSDRYVREGKWGKEPLALARRFSGACVGVLGLGRVGMAVASRCAAFGCTVLFCDPHVAQHATYTRYESLEAMARDADYLVVAAAAATQTNKLVDASILNALGADGVLINISRGSVVDEPALVEALLAGYLGAAGLDVFAHEPAVPEALLGLDNVVLSPHRASATVETRRAMGDLLVANLEAHFSGRELTTPVL